MINRISSFIKIQYKYKDMTVDWSLWMIYAPTEIPYQKVENDPGGNCDVHTCIRGYIISSGNYILFDESDMSNARAANANYLIKTQAPTIERQKIKIREMVTDFGSKTIA